jgi:competence protein ComEA
MNSNWKDYFAFTKKERTGILMLVALIAITITIPYFFPTVEDPDEASIEAFNAQKAQLEKLQQGMRQSYAEQRDNYAQLHYEPENEQPAVILFRFDPNTVNAAGWRKLGVNNRTIRTIQNYISKGGRFRKPVDLQKIYGMKKEEYERLLPYVQIIADTTPRFNYSNAGKKEKYVKAPPPIVDINMADTTAFIALPGIGSKLATRIVNFREKLGGFYSVNQLGETYGLPDSTFQLLKPRLQCAVTSIRKMNINTADANTLKQHPYIRWNIANAIVQFRQQHGNYRSPNDLQQIVLITPELFQKIVGYITVE